MEETVEQMIARARDLTKQLNDLHTGIARSGVNVEVGIDIQHVVSYYEQPYIYAKYSKPM